MEVFEFSQLARDILDLAASYSKTGSNNEPMERREALLRVLSSEIDHLLVRGNFNGELLKVQHGGRQANYSPVCWVRIFDPGHAPTAQSGFYVVLLFAADGSCVYLSLNQGTSEFRSNKMRPILRDDVLLNRGSEARLLLADWDTRVSRAGTIAMDLHGDSAPVEAESRRRIRNYELANIYAYRYSREQLPSQSQFEADLEELLVLLWALEDAEVSEPTQFIRDLAHGDETPPQRRRPSARQGRQMDAALRRQIELTAEDVVEAYFVGEGWSVERVGSLKLGFDLRCTRLGEELHVEVKGTTGQGQEVTLTPNEVDHARNYPTSALAVVSQISISLDGSVNSRGVLKLLEPWVVDDSRLVPSEFVYRV